MIRLVVLIALTLSAAGCGDGACGSNEFVVNATFDAQTAAADSLTVSVSIDGVLLNTTQAVHNVGDLTERLEIDFNDGYPVGHDVKIGVVAEAGTTLLAQGSVEYAALGKSCVTAPLSLIGSGDLSIPPDLETVD